jgi:predicted amidohydrolase YtcJ
MLPRVTCLIGLLLAARAYAKHEAADAIYFSGKVQLLDDDFTRAQALAVGSGRIIAVGNNAEVLRLAGPHTRMINLQGRALLPGFVDAHTHLWNHSLDVGIPLEEAQQMALAAGVTALGDPTHPGFVPLIEEFAATGKLYIRTSLYPGYNTPCGFFLGEDESHPSYLEFPVNRDPEAILRIPGVKFFADGGSCNLPATSFELIVDPPQDPPLGDLYWATEALTVAVAQADAAGYQIAIHAIGDRAQEVAAAATDNALAGRENVLHHRIEHNSFMRPEQIAYSHQVGIVPIVWINTCEGIENLDLILPDFARPWYQPWGALLATGSEPAWHGDWPFRPFEPIRFHLYGLVTRTPVRDDGSICEAFDWYAAGAVTVHQALRMMTRGGAYALGMEEVIGSLEPGKFADLIILSADPLEVAVSQIKDIAVLSTVIGGVPRFCAAGEEKLCGN